MSNNEQKKDDKLPEKKKPTGFIAAFKAKAMEQLVNEKNEGSDNNEDNVEDLYLDKEQKQMLEKTRCLIRGHSKWKLRWDLIVMILAIFN